MNSVLVNTYVSSGVLTAMFCLSQPEEFADPPDIFALGFQELVGLTASNIVSAR